MNSIIGVIISRNHVLCSIAPASRKCLLSALKYVQYLYVHSLRYFIGKFATALERRCNSLVWEKWKNMGEEVDENVYTQRTNTTVSESFRSEVKNEPLILNRNIFGALTSYHHFAFEILR